MILVNFEKYMQRPKKIPFGTSFDKTFEIIRFFENMIKVRQFPNNNNKNNNYKVILKNASAILARVQKTFIL